MAAATTAPRTRGCCAQGSLAKKLARLRHRTGLRLTLAVFALCAVLWIVEVDVVWQLARTTHWKQHLRLSGAEKSCVKVHEGHIERAYFHPERCHTRADIQKILLELVWTLADVFERNDIPYWLDSGTLLGAYRDKTVIPYDNDADFGITKAAYLTLRDRELAGIPDAYELQVFRGKFHHQGSRDAAIPSRFIHRDSGFYVDIFVFLQSQKRETHFGPLPSVCFMGCFRCRVLSGGRTVFKIPKAWVFPLQTCAFGGRNVSCPSQPEKYLDYLYGPEFMTPNKS